MIEEIKVSNCYNINKMIEFFDIKFDEVDYPDLGDFIKEVSEEITNQVAVNALGFKYSSFFEAVGDLRSRVYQVEAGSKGLVKGLEKLSETFYRKDYDNAVNDINLKLLDINYLVSDLIILYTILLNISEANDLEGYPNRINFNQAAAAIHKMKENLEEEGVSVTLSANNESVTIGDDEDE